MSKMAAARDAYGKTLIELGKKDKKIVVVDADLSSSTRTAWFGKEFPDRFFNIGVAEADMIGTAAGLALTDHIVFASTFAIFASGRAWEQIRNTVAHNKLNVKIVTTHGGITVGEDGASHQALEDIAIIRAIPELRVIIPADANETISIIKTIAYEPGPFYLRLSRSPTPVLYDSPEKAKFVIGKGQILREGNDITLIGCGIMTSECLQAAEQLAQQGIKARVVNMSSLKPIDKDLIIDSAKKTKAIVTAEEHSIIGGLGSAVAEVVVEKYPTKMKIIGVQDVFGESGSPKELLEKFNLTAGNIVSAAQELLK